MGDALDKHNKKNNIFNLQYNSCGPGQPDYILKILQLTERELKNSLNYPIRLKMGSNLHNGKISLTVS